MNKICALRLNNSTGWEFLCFCTRSYLSNVEPQKCFMKIWQRNYVCACVRWYIVDTHPVNYNANFMTTRQADLEADLYYTHYSMSLVEN